MFTLCSFGMAEPDIVPECAIVYSRENGGPRTDSTACAYSRSIAPSVSGTGIASTRIIGAFPDLPQVGPNVLVSESRCVAFQP